jgi:hypothetical protein
MGLDFQHIKGDTFDEVYFSIKINSVALDLTNSVIKMQLRKDAYDHTTPASLTLTSVANNGITITQASLGRFKINAQIIDIDVYNYSYDLQITQSNGVVKTFIKGFFDIIIDITI